MRLCCPVIILAYASGYDVSTMTRNIQQIRNIGVIAHIDAGKTTLTERMLFYSGATHRMGDVDKGTTTTDSDEEEQQRGITIYSACVTFKWKDVVVNLIDTPGHVDFTAEVERSLRVLDGGVVVFSAREGVEAQSETVWRQADRYGVPRIAFINKMDREGADFEGTVEQIRKRLGSNPLPVQIPVGAGPPHLQGAFRGIIDLVDMKLLTFPEESKGAKVVAVDIPDEFAKEASAARNSMLEVLYEYSDELMELAIQEKPIPADLVHRVLRQATVHRFIVPVLCGSALDHAGVQPVLDAVAAYLPSPKDVPPVEGTRPEKGAAASKREKRQAKKSAGKGAAGGNDETETRRADEKEPFCALVFKIEAAKHGDLYFVRVYSGELSANSRTYNPTKDKKENVSQLWHIQSDDRQQVKSVAAGDIVGVIGLRHSVTGDTLCDPQHPIVLESIAFPETVISMAIEPETSTDRKKLAAALEVMKRQDPTFRAAESEETGQTIISGMGELHLEVIKHKLLRDFNLNVKVHKPRVSYRETIQQPVEVTGECHRQIAGQQTFGEVTLRMEPWDEGEDPVTVACDSAGNLSEEMIAVVLDELTDIGRGGGLFGNPLMKLKVTLTGGQQREGESTDVAFRIASNDAFNVGLREAGVVLLEPIMKMQITCPEEYLGDFISDLQKRRASIQRTTTRDEMVIIDATAPLASLFGYSSTMRGLSQGRATHSMEPSAYGPAPPGAAG